MYSKTKHYLIALTERKLAIEVYICTPGGRPKRSMYIGTLTDINWLLVNSSIHRSLHDQIMNLSLPFALRFQGGD